MHTVARDASSGAVKRKGSIFVSARAGRAGFMVLDARATDGAASRPAREAKSQMFLSLWLGGLEVAASTRSICVFPE